jgi:transitional endoplasmic reticulum ATPase
MEILEVHLRGTPVGCDVSLQQLAEATAGYTGADLAAVCREVKPYSNRHWV